MRRLLILFVAAGMAFAQDAPKAPQPQPPQIEAEIIPVRTLSGDSFNRLVKLLEVFGARYTADEQLRTILVYAPKDVVAQMRRVVEQLDRPGSEATFGRNIEMTLTLLRCSTKAPAAASALPPDMEPVAKQLRAATQYKEIQLWDVVPLRLQEGRDTQESLRLPVPGGATQLAAATGQIRIHPEAVYRKDQARFVRFSRVDLGFRIPVPTGVFRTGGTGDAAPLVPTQYTMVDVGLQTSGDFQEGQKTVLGKVSGVEEGDAIFAVIALKVLD
jgi:hypothetical protein